MVSEGYFINLPVITGKGQQDDVFGSISLPLYNNANTEYYDFE